MTEAEARSYFDHHIRTIESLDGDYMGVSIRCRGIHLSAVSPDTLWEKFWARVQAGATSILDDQDGEVD